MLPRIHLSEASKSHRNGKELITTERRNRSKQERVPEAISIHHYERLGDRKKSIPKYVTTGLDFQGRDKKENIFKTSTDSGNFLRDVIQRRRHSSSSCTTLADVSRKQPVLIRNNHISLRKYSCPDLRSHLVSTNTRLQTTKFELKKVYETGRNVRTSVSVKDDHERLTQAKHHSSFPSEATNHEEKLYLDIVRTRKNPGNLTKQLQNLKVVHEIISFESTAIMSNVVPKPDQEVASVSDEDSKSQLLAEWLDNSDLSYTGEVRNCNSRCVSTKFQPTRGRDSIIAWLQDISLG